MDKIIVLLAGSKSQAGKDTFGAYIKDLGFQRVSFADKLKQTVMDLYGFNHEQMYGDLKDIEDKRYPNLIDQPTIKRSIVAKTPNGLGGEIVSDPLELEVANPDYKPYFTPRRILQLFGQQQRSLFPDIWAAYVFYSTVEELSKKGISRFIVTDLRFPNEIAVAKRWASENTNRYVFPIKVYRPGVLAKSGANDISETALDNYEEWSEILRNDVEGEDGLKIFRERCRRLAIKYIDLVDSEYELTD